MNGQTLELVITLTPEGQVGVRGPIDQLLVCYGMLDLAKDAIRQRAATQGQQRIVQPVIVPPNGHLGA